VCEGEFGGVKMEGCDRREASRTVVHSMDSLYSFRSFGTLKSIGLRHDTFVVVSINPAREAGIVQTRAGRWYVCLDSNYALYGPRLRVLLFASCTICLDWS